MSEFEKQFWKANKTECMTSFAGFAPRFHPEPLPVFNALFPFPLYIAICLFIVRLSVCSPLSLSPFSHSLSLFFLFLYPLLSVSVYHLLSLFAIYTLFSLLLFLSFLSRAFFFLAHPCPLSRTLSLSVSILLYPPYLSSLSSPSFLHHVSIHASLFCEVNIGYSYSVEKLGNNIFKKESCVRKGKLR